MQQRVPQPKGKRHSFAVLRSCCEKYQGYDSAVNELEKLVTKRKQLEDKRLLEAYHAGTKTADEIIAFIQPEDLTSD